MLMLLLLLLLFVCFNPLLFASCTDTFSKWCKITVVVIVVGGGGVFSGGRVIIGVMIVMIVGGGATYCLAHFLTLLLGQRSMLKVL
jgi:hypothetical protein